MGFARGEEGIFYFAFLEKMLDQRAVEGLSFRVGNIGFLFSPLE